MLLPEGSKILVVHRRLFERDEGRFFLGTVEGYESGIVLVTGYTFVRDQLSGEMKRKADSRTKLISVTSGTMLVYKLPDDVEIAQTKFVAQESELYLTDGKNLQMNLSEGRTVRLAESGLDCQRRPNRRLTSVV